MTIVEPGAFPTGFAGAKNMRSETPIEACLSVIAPVEQYLYGSDGQQPGDPARAADAMLQAVDSLNPPLRLPLGSDAIDLWETKRAAVHADLAA